MTGECNGWEDTVGWLCPKACAARQAQNQQLKEQKQKEGKPAVAAGASVGAGAVVVTSADTLGGCSGKEGTLGMGGFDKLVSRATQIQVVSADTLAVIQIQPGFVLSPGVANNQKKC